MAVYPKMIHKTRVNWWKGYETLLSDREPVHPEDVEPLKRMLRERVRGMYYNPLPFKEFVDIPPLRHYPEQRLELVMPWVDFKDKTVVDIGANMGYYSFMAAELGAAYVVPIETYTKGCEVMERVAKIYGYSQIHTWSQNVKEFPFDKVKPDIVFAFSVLPYLGQPDPEPLRIVLRSLARNCDTTFIEMGDGGSKLDWCEGDEAFEKLFQSSGFRHVEAIASVDSTHAGTKRTLWVCRGTR